MADLQKIIVDWQQNFPILKSYSPSTIFMNADCFLIGLRFISHYAHDYTVQFEWIPLWDDMAVKILHPILYNEVHVKGLNSPYCIYYNSHEKIYPRVVELAKEQFGSIIQEQIFETALLSYVSWYAANTAFGLMKNHPLNGQIWRIRLAMATFFGDTPRYERILTKMDKSVALWNEKQCISLKNMTPNEWKEEIYREFSNREAFLERIKRNSELPKIAKLNKAHIINDLSSDSNLFEQPGIFDKIIKSATRFFKP